MPLEIPISLQCGLRKKKKKLEKVLGDNVGPRFRTFTTGGGDKLFAIRQKKCFEHKFVSLSYFAVFNRLFSLFQQGSLIFLFPYVSTNERWALARLLAHSAGLVLDPNDDSSMSSGCRRASLGQHWAAGNKTRLAIWQQWSFMSHDDGIKPRQTDRQTDRRTDGQTTLLLDLYGNIWARSGKKQRHRHHWACSSPSHASQAKLASYRRGRGGTGTVLPSG